MVGQGKAWQPGPIPPQTGAGQRGGTGAAAALGIGHLPGDGGGLRPGWDMGPRVGPVQWDPWPGRAGCGELETGPDVGLMSEIAISLTLHCVFWGRCVKNSSVAYILSVH